MAAAASATGPASGTSSLKKENKKNRFPNQEAGQKPAPTVHPSPIVTRAFQNAAVQAEEVTRAAICKPCGRVDIRIALFVVSEHSFLALLKEKRR